MTTSRIGQVRQLTEWLQATDISLLELRAPGESIRLCRQASGEVREAAADSAPATAPTSATVVRAGSVGIVLHSHPLRSEPLVKPGQQVAAGQPVALLRIGLVLLPVGAPRAGVVSRILSTHESAVGFGTPLVELAS
ncbi:acetyl-CoA carboxylase biotin carboxyl carrier protein subunit [Variovorax sp. OV329]|uniref:acetyl-CoA carboxylase biotin carboxyl carrier protein n=1 Tax=Variovorax sp. OV329 TaxID=1882825 RepID=UPI0008EE8314|nr:acetyl-CoA carboxylase biotin carboxyl carrier protein subunit [Variovorax sp. OV329]SFL97090.1 acetyl-CoA carboxylase biotin carboxyl carrier protein [Variovorax sp. OV329]